MMTNHDREWLLHMARVEEEALRDCGGVLACSPEIFQMMKNIEADLSGQPRSVTVSVPAEILKRMKG